MRDTIKGVVLGALVAAGVSVLLAQSATWTTPRNWATDDLLTATDFNAQFRDNLLWLREDAQLSGTDALEDLGCGTLGTNEVLFSDCTWATIPAGVVFDIHDDVRTHAGIADSDRIPFSDESVSGDPMRFNTAANLAEYMQVEVRLNASRVTAGTFNTARIPNLSASKITSGTFQTARIPTIPTNSLANDAVTQAKMADNAVGPAEMDPESATTGQVMMIGSGGNPTWSFPFEFPRTRSTRAVDVSGSGDKYSIVTSTINVGDNDNAQVSVSATFTLSGISGGGCTVQFSGIGGSGGVTAYTTNGAKTLTATVEAGELRRGSALPFVLFTYRADTSAGCTVNSGATLTLTIP